MTSLAIQPLRSKGIRVSLGDFSLYVVPYSQFEEIEIKTPLFYHLLISLETEWEKALFLHYHILRKTKGLPWITHTLPYFQSETFFHVKSEEEQLFQLPAYFNSEAWIALFRMLDRELQVFINQCSYSETERYPLEGMLLDFHHEVTSTLMQQDLEKAYVEDGPSIFESVRKEEARLSLKRRLFRQVEAHARTLERAFPLCERFMPSPRVHTIKKVIALFGLEREGKVKAWIERMGHFYHIARAFQATPLFLSPTNDLRPLIGAALHLHEASQKAIPAFEIVEQLEKAFPPSKEEGTLENPLFKALLNP